jgi:hypothetical protein
MQLRILTIVLLLAATVFSAHGQSLDPETAGRHYVIAFPDTTRDYTDFRFPSPLRDTAAIWIYSDVDNSVRIQGPGYDRTVFPHAGSFEIVYLDDTSGATRPIIVDSIGRITNTVFRVDAEHPIVLYCYIVTKWGGEAWTPIPVENWGREYYAASLESEVVKSLKSPSELSYSALNIGEGAQILIISASDNTSIHIYPTDRLNGNTDTIVTLQKNQAYLVQSWLDTTTSHFNLPHTDIGGTRILADKPIGVISGNTRAMGNPKDPIGYMKSAFKNLLAEWLAPVDQHGREFVYLPTWDSRHITGDSGEVLKEKRSREIVRLYGTNAGGAAVNVVDSVVQYLGALTPSQVLSDTARFSHPRVYLSGAPIQVVMTSTAVGFYKNNPHPDIPGSGTYDAWSPYMVDLTPREQWSNFAPYYAPEYPIDMEHFVNVVADTVSATQIVTEDGLPVAFDRPITGTDLVWTTLAVSPGKSHYLRGLNPNATFFAFAYGLFKGRDAFAAQSTLKRDDPVLTGGGRDDKLLAPKIYEEIVAISYGYPIAPRRTTLGEGDIFQIDRVGTRCALDVHAYATNQNPLGLRSVSLDSVVNARLESVDPASFADIRGRSDVKVRVLAVDPLQDAKATVVFTDRTGRRSTTPFLYRREGGSLGVINSLDFGSVWVGTAVDTTITLKNNSAEDLCIGGFRMAHGGAGFSIVSDGGAPRTLKPGEEMIMTVRASPTSRDSVALDTLLVKLCCGEIPISVRTGVLSGVDSQNALENGIALIQPNPTTERAKITVRMRHSGNVTVRIFRSTGELVREVYSGTLGAGEHRMIWDAAGEAAGGYRCQVQGPEWSGSAAIMVVR